ncbi:hypothetical protein B0H11DRAFT_402208 [Mycena galericulata]|nr:hypothetical protein B0H11DRAFT_402208 [Mycena galericulata]
MPRFHAPSIFSFLTQSSFCPPTSSAMARSTPQKTESGSSATCEHCGASMKRISDLRRHMLIHAKNKEEFMYTCPVEGCSHATLQKSNLATHIRTHTRAKPHKCPEYLPNGQKCDFATADPSSLHRHRKRKHGYQPRLSTATSSTMPSGSGTRDKSVDCWNSFESEESFGLRPESADADQGSAPEHTNIAWTHAIHRPYFNPDKLSGQRYDSPYYLPFALKVPEWIDAPHSEVTFQTFSCGSEYGVVSTTDITSQRLADDTSLSKHCPELAQADLGGCCATVCHSGHELPGVASTYYSPISPSFSPLSVLFIDSSLRTLGRSFGWSC